MTAYPDDGVLKLEAGGKIVSGWQNIRVTCGIERCPSDFDISVTEKLPGSAFDVPFIANDVCRVSIGGDLVLTGYVERYMPSITASDHTVRVAGRSTCCDLVDCMVDYRQHPVINGQNLFQIATLLSASYGISVQALSGEGPLVQQLTVNLGESVYQVIERIARYGAMLVYDDPSGNLILSQVGVEKMASGFEQGLNVLDASVDFNMSERFNEYHAFRLSVDSLSDLTAPSSADGNEITVVTDQGMAGFKRPDGQPRVRKMAVISEQMDLAQQFATIRANYEMGRRYGRSQAVRLVADSWRDKAGKLWKPNHRVQLKLPALKLADVEYVVGEVSFIRDDQGTRAALTLMPPEAYQPEPVILNPYDAQIRRDLSESGNDTPAARDGRRDRG